MTDYIDPTEIVILPDRQRKDADPKDLIESIRRWGIINPIVLDSEKTLIAGERRLRAALELGLDLVPVRYLEDMSEAERQVIELEENLSRKDLSWQDEVDAVFRIWQLRGEPEYKELGEYLGRSHNWVYRRLACKRALEQNPDLTEAPSLVNALNTAKRREKRKITATIGAEVSLPGEQKTGDRKTNAMIINADFLEWAASADERFNFIHVDLPYGVGMDKSGIKSEYNTKVYEDSPGTYLRLMRGFFEHVDRFAAPDCHIMWWLSSKFLRETVEAFEAAGFEVWRDPLVWCYGANFGIAAYPDRFPRHSYEIALLAVRGDRPLVVCRQDSFVRNPQLDDRLHPSEKPREMLEHFFKMFVDHTSAVLDPTCGSGNSIAVAVELGAAKAIGIELDPEYAKIAEENVNAK